MLLRFEKIDKRFAHIGACPLRRRMSAGHPHQQPRAASIDSRNCPQRPKVRTIKDDAHQPREWIECGEGGRGRGR